MSANPQKVTCSAHERVRFYVTMSPAESIAGDTFALSVRSGGTLEAQVTTHTVVSEASGVFYLELSSAVTGDDLGPGDYEYDVWRTTAGSEARLAWGALNVLRQQWQ